MELETQVPGHRKEARVEGCCTYQAIQIEYPETVIDNFVSASSQPEYEVADLGYKRGNISTKEEKKLNHMKADEYLPEPVGFSRLCRLHRGKKRQEP